MSSLIACSAIFDRPRTGWFFMHFCTRKINLIGTGYREEVLYSSWVVSESLPYWRIKTKFNVTQKVTTEHGTYLIRTVLRQKVKRRQVLEERPYVKNYE
jgi:hypothetical protein